MHYSVPAAALLSLAAVASAQHPLYTRSHEVYARNPVAASIDPNNFISAQDLYARMAAPEPEYNIPPSALRARQIALLRRNLAPKMRRHNTGRPHTHKKHRGGLKGKAQRLRQKVGDKIAGNKPTDQMSTQVEPQQPAADPNAQPATTEAAPTTQNVRRAANPSPRGKGGKGGKKGRKHRKHRKGGKKGPKGPQQGAEAAQGAQGAEAQQQPAEGAPADPNAAQPAAGGDAGAAPAPAPAKVRRNALAIASRSAAPAPSSSEASEGWFAMLKRAVGF